MEAGLKKWVKRRIRHNSLLFNELKKVGQVGQSGSDPLFRVYLLTAQRLQKVGHHSRGERPEKRHNRLA
jgi:hypothetical protein